MQTFSPGDRVKVTGKILNGASGVVEDCNSVSEKYPIVVRFKPGIIDDVDFGTELVSFAKNELELEEQPLYILSAPELSPTKVSVNYHTNSWLCTCFHQGEKGENHVLPCKVRKLYNQLTEIMKTLYT